MKPIKIPKRTKGENFYCAAERDLHLIAPEHKKPWPIPKKHVVFIPKTGETIEVYKLHPACLYYYAEWSNCQRVFDEKDLQFLK